MWHYFALAASQVTSVAICAVTMTRTLARDTSALSKSQRDAIEAGQRMKEEYEARFIAERRTHEVAYAMQSVYAILGSCEHAPKVVYPEAPWGMCLACVIAACEQIEKALPMPGGASMRARWTQKRGLE